METDITEYDRQVMQYIEHYWARWAQSPAVRDIQEHFKTSALRTSQDSVQRLIEAGYLKKKPKMPRGLFLTNKRMFF